MNPGEIDNRSLDMTEALLQRENLRLREVVRRLLRWLGYGPICMSKSALADILGCSELELYWLRRALKASCHIREEKCCRDGSTVVLHSTSATASHEH